MFDIKIGTMVPLPHFAQMLPRLNGLGFESYELHMEPYDPHLDYQKLADAIRPNLEGRPISVFGIYGNTLTDPDKDATIAWDVIREHGIASGHGFMWDRTPGFGDTNWNDVLTILMQAGYKGTVDIEGYHDPVYYDDAEWSAQLRGLQYLKDCRGGQVWIPPMAYNGWRSRGR